MSNEQAPPDLPAASTAPDGYREAVALLRACSTEHGFVAAPTQSQNYRRIWGRDGAIIALAALLTGDADLCSTARRTIETLARHQGPHGEIPSNVDPVSGRISYGGTTGRVDSNLWFLIACGEYWRATGDDPFLEQLVPAIERVCFLLGAWEFNNRGLIYVPLTGDWADEYLHNGYVLYDQLLYLQAKRTLASIHNALHGSTDHALAQSISRLRHLIRANYWFAEAEVRDDVYHEVLYRKGLKAASHCRERYWMASFSPSGYSYRFDAFANVLASLFDVADDAQRHNVDAYIFSEVVNDELDLLPAFHPVIKPVDEDWEHLQVMFSYTFKNKPYEYHNGGLWPMVTGFCACDLARRGRMQKAQRLVEAINRANAMPMDGVPWGFAEYIHGKELKPQGTKHQGWSAAAAVMAQRTLDGGTLFRIDDSPTKR
jgi:GH15 family glucan-1,4-alpha-glucosidase